MKLMIFVCLLVFFLAGCENPVDASQKIPNVPNNLNLLTPQQDQKAEFSANITNDETMLWYGIYIDDNDYLLESQYIGNSERTVWIYFLNTNTGNDKLVIKLSPNNVFLVTAWQNVGLGGYNPGGAPFDLVTSNTATTPRISPNSDWIAYKCSYESEPPDNVYIITPQGDQVGPRIQITHSESAPQGFQYLFIPVCWLSNSEIVIRRQRNIAANDFTSWAYDMQKYNIDDLSSPPVLLSTVEGDEHQPMGYSELINQNEGWYIDSFGDVQAGYSNLYKCPLGVAGDYGEQLTFGGNWDIPDALSADGHKLLFTRKYRRGCYYLTGNSDIYMMDLANGSQFLALKQ